MEEKDKQDIAKQNQHNSATGENDGEQGQASFSTGSTSQGGSNYGQGSSQLGGESYQQGDTSNRGANYNNEDGSLISNSTGNRFEDGSVASAGITGVGNSYGQGAVGNISPSSGNDNTDTDRESESNRGQDSDKENFEDGHRKDTDLERDSSLGEDRNEGRSSGSWSRGTL